MPLKRVLLTILAGLALAGCSETLDSVLWDCQLAVQKDNAVRTKEADAERARDIDACMQGRGYGLDIRKPACLPGSVHGSCYLRR